MSSSIHSNFFNSTLISPAKMILFVAVFILSMATTTVLSYETYKHIQYPEYGPDIDGPAYCGRRPHDQCCAGRNDHCTVAILDTICYCDLFCNRTVADCCPDFWRLCVGIDPPRGAWRPPAISNDIQNNCYHEGVQYQQGSELKVNCNNCSCIKVPGKQEINWKCTQEICLIREDIINAVNSDNLGWTASNYSSFWGKTLNHGVTYRLGTFEPTESVDSMTSIRVNVDRMLPDSFDARIKWPGLIHDILDQGDCGASWAFSTAEVASDRLSIHSRGMFRELLSPQHILSCDLGNDHQKGCEGGYIDRAWWFLRRIGVVSNDCYPYKSQLTSEKGQCLIERKYYHRPGTQLVCPVYGLRSRVYQASPPYRISNNEAEIMKEIMDNGPVQATMEVREDFFMYNTGVYQYSVPEEIMNENHRKSGFHSAKIIGWGTDYSLDGIARKYWLVANSWGRQWGEDGYFRILRGVNECSIESFVVGAWAKVNGRDIINKYHNNMQGDGPDNSGSGTDTSGGNIIDISGNSGSGSPEPISISSGSNSGSGGEFKILKIPKILGSGGVENSGGSGTDASGKIASGFESGEENSGHIYRLPNSGNGGESSTSSGNSGVGNLDSTFSIDLNSGAESGVSGNSGSIDLNSGAESGVSGNSGSIDLNSGAESGVSGNLGSIDLNSGAESDLSGNSGNTVPSSSGSETSGNSGSGTVNYLFIPSSGSETSGTSGSGVTDIGVLPSYGNSGTTETSGNSGSSGTDESLLDILPGSGNSGDTSGGHSGKEVPMILVAISGSGGLEATSGSGTSGSGTETPIYPIFVSGSGGEKSGSGADDSNIFNNNEHKEIVLDGDRSDLNTNKNERMVDAGIVFNDHAAVSSNDNSEDNHSSNSRLLDIIGNSLHMRPEEYHVLSKHGKNPHKSSFLNEVLMDVPPLKPNGKVRYNTGERSDNES